MAKLLLVLFSLFAISQAIFWKDCGSKQGKVSNVVVSGCSTTADKNPCHLKKGRNATFTVDFTPTETVTKATSVVHGIVAGVPVPFPLPHSDGCTDSGLNCPLKPNDKVSFKQNIPVRTSYPSIKLVVKWELKDQSTTDIFCIEVLAEVDS